MACLAAGRARGTYGRSATAPRCPIPPRTGQPCPPTAQHAIRQGRLVARNIAATLGRHGAKPFRYRTKGVVAELGDNQAVAITLGIRWRGLPAWLIARTYHLLLMPGIGRKLRLLVDWNVALMFGRDASRPGGWAIADARSKARTAADRSVIATRRILIGEMAILEQIKADLQGAMRAGEKERVGALRLVLSELQKAAKEGADDELAVLRRERKRRLEAAQAYRDAGQRGPRRRRAGRRRADRRLPARRALRGGARRRSSTQAVRDSGAQSAKDMGARDGHAMAAVDGRADGKRVSALVRARARRDEDADRALQRGRRRAGGQPGRGPARAGGAPGLQGLPAREPVDLRRRGARDAAPASGSCASWPS